MRVLIYGVTDNYGGIESFLITYIREILRIFNDIHFDFLAPYSYISIENEVLDMGCAVYHLPNRKRSFFKYQREIRKFFKVNAPKYDVVWLNDCLFCNLDSLRFAKKYGIKGRIIHAHNSSAMGSLSQFIRHQIGKHLLILYATDYWACSDKAAIWSYTREIVKNKKYSVVVNAINTERFQYDVDRRQKIREALKLNGRLVIGNIGRLHFQKNQEFLLDIFSKLYEKEKNSILVLVGDGPDKHCLKEKVKNLGLEKKVIFMGFRDDVPDLLLAMDVFVLPSRFEGLGIVAIEAQCCGLPCVLSDEVPACTKILDTTSYLGLDYSPDFWAEKILEYKDIDRGNRMQEVEAAGFGIKTQSAGLVNMLRKSGGL